MPIWVAVLVASILIAACGRDATPTPTVAAPPPPIDTPAPAVEVGFLDVRVTDALNWTISEILITVSEIQVHQADAPDGDGWLTVLEGEHQFDLLKVVGQEQTLGVGELPPGTYTQIRMTAKEVLVTDEVSNGRPPSPAA